MRQFPSSSLLLTIGLCLGGVSAAGQIVRSQAPPSSPDTRLRDAAAALRPDVLTTLAQLVNIDSGTGNEAGVNQVGTIVATQLRQLGATVESHPAKPAAGNNIVARFAGTGRGRILLIGHLDTVFAPGTASARPFRIEGTRAYGPGVADNKGGIVAGLFAMKLLRQLAVTDYGRITVLLNTNEETGSGGSRSLIEAEARQHDVVLNLEPGRPADGLVVWRKGSGTLRIEVRGRTAHAGVAPETGRNAAVELAHQVLKMSALSNAETGTTVNMTVLTAGDRRNVIPDFASADGDVRVTTAAEFDRVERDVAALIRDKLIPDTTVTATLTRGFPPMPKNAAADALAARAQAIYGELGAKLTLEGSGGAADSSLAAGVGTPTLDGLGIVGGNTHTADEYIEVNSIGPRLYLLTRLLIELGR